MAEISAERHEPDADADADGAAPVAGGGLKLTSGEFSAALAAADLKLTRDMPIATAGAL